MEKLGLGGLSSSEKSLLVRRFDPMEEGMVRERAVAVLVTVRYRRHFMRYYCAAAIRCESTRGKKRLESSRYENEGSYRSSGGGRRACLVVTLDLRYA